MIARLKTVIKKAAIKLCRRLGDVSPIKITWNDIADHAIMPDVLGTMRTAKFYEPREVEAPSNAKVLILAPHPDDEIIGVGGTILKMQAQGCDIHVLHFTLGDAPEVYEESLAVNKDMNLSGHYLNFTVDEIPVDSAAIEKTAEAINGINPDMIFVPFVLDDNEDHRRVNEILHEIQNRSDLKRPDKTQLWAYQVYSFFPINAVVKITNEMNKKTEAMRLYESQFKVRDWAHFMKGLNAFNIRFLTGYAGEEYVEVFYQDSLKHYMDLCASYFENGSERCYTNQHYRT